jgi:hypothetical protein
VPSLPGPPASGEMGARGRVCTPSAQFTRRSEGGPTVGGLHASGSYGRGARQAWRAPTEQTRTTSETLRIVRSPALVTCAHAITPGTGPRAEQTQRTRLLVRSRFLTYHRDRRIRILTAFIFQKLGGAPTSPSSEPDHFHSTDSLQTQVLRVGISRGGSWGSVNGRLLGVPWWPLAVGRCSDFGRRSENRACPRSRAFDRDHEKMGARGQGVSTPSAQFHPPLRRRSPAMGGLHTFGSYGRGARRDHARAPSDADKRSSGNVTDVESIRAITYGHHRSAQKERAFNT